MEEKAASDIFDLWTLDIVTSKLTHLPIELVAPLSIFWFRIDHAAINRLPHIRERVFGMIEYRSTVPGFVGTPT